MVAYYNENDPFAAQWLRNLVTAGHIAGGDVDERSVVDVRPDDLRSYAQCHLFAGIGGWSLALRLAGWPDDRPVWTGSCPCQPFSAAGKRGGFGDERDLWPIWCSLIGECGPAVVFGEQVARSAEWQRRLYGDLEGLDYAVGCMPIEAASVGAPHLRDRFWFVAYAIGAEVRNDQQRMSARWPQGVCDQGQALARHNGAHGDVADAGEPRLPPSECGPILTARRWHEGRAVAECDWWAVEPGVGRVAHGVPGRVGRLRAYGNAIVPQVAAEFIRAALKFDTLGENI